MRTFRKKRPRKHAVAVSLARTHFFFIVQFTFPGKGIVVLLFRMIQPLKVIPSGSIVQVHRSS